MSLKTITLCTSRFVRFINCARTFRTSSICYDDGEHYDIIITGGGMVGTAMACAVAQTKKLSDTKVLLIESSSKNQYKQKLKNDETEYSNRVVSLTPGTRKFFENIGVWKHITESRFKTVKKMQVWDACSDALITFNDDLEHDVSYIVENDVVLSALDKVLEQTSVKVKYQRKVKQMVIPDQFTQKVKVEMDNGDSSHCKLLIGADGVNSPTRKAMGCQYLSWSYNQLGVVATLQLSEPTENVVAWQRFLPTGPIALLPLTDTLSSLVWSTSVSKAQQLLKSSDEEFVDAVNDAFWSPACKHPLVESASQSLDKCLSMLNFKTGAVRQLPPSVSAVTKGSRAAFPLGFGHAAQYVAPGAALVGDAAHRVHPLAGQGVNLGFGDIQCLSRLLADAVYSGQHLGSSSVLRNYESSRQKHNFPTMVAIDGLQKLYSTSLPPVVLLRSIGLQLTQSLTPLKNTIMVHASA